MAVYTEVPDDALRAFLGSYDLGTPRSFKGIAEGIENSNYLLNTTCGAYILTLYEKRTTDSELPFFLNLMEHLAAKGVPCPVPIRDRKGNALRRLCGKPAALVSFLDGLSPRQITTDHCRSLGLGLARFHGAGQGFAGQRPNALGVSSWQPLFAQCRGFDDGLFTDLAENVAAELDYLIGNWPRGLPEGIIHGDLFPDNAFFSDGALSGIIDPYFACTEALAYDVAICLNAWCFDEKCNFNNESARALVAGYQSARALSEKEKAEMPVLLRGAAMRFFLTRLYDWTQTPDAPLTRRKDPLEFWVKLCALKDGEQRVFDCA